MSGSSACPGPASVYRQTEADLIRNLQNPQIRYLDYFTGDYDHVAHLTADPVSQLHALENLDALVGRIWNAIAASPLAAHTALVLVSDHGMNTSETVFSQGFSLVDWFNSPGRRSASRAHQPASAHRVQAQGTGSVRLRSHHAEPGFELIWPAKPTNTPP